MLQCPFLCLEACTKLVPTSASNHKLRKTCFLWLRWLNKEGRSSQLGSFVPFSAGPRMCIGYSFALQEIKVGFACGAALQ